MKRSRAQLVATTSFGRFNQRNHQSKIMSFLKEFRDFAMRGSVIDLAIGVIIGAAFGKIVNALVNSVIMPPIGLLLGRVDFSSVFLNLSGQPAGSLKEASDKGLQVVAYGAFLKPAL